VEDRILGPSTTGCIPDHTIKSTSVSLNPPSGPIATRTSPSACPVAAKPCMMVSSDSKYGCATTLAARQRLASSVSLIMPSSRQETPHGNAGEVCSAAGPGISRAPEQRSAPFSVRLSKTRGSCVSPACSSPLIRPARTCSAPQLGLSDAVLATCFCVAGQSQWHVSPVKAAGPLKSGNSFQHALRCSAPPPSPPLPQAVGAACRHHYLRGKWSS
jgi:hypothetical protein